LNSKNFQIKKPVFQKPVFVYSYYLFSQKLRGFFENEALPNKSSGKILQWEQVKAAFLLFNLCPAHQ
jgi:hypothetical protein